MTYTLGEAARATGMSKAAISRAIKNGTLSAARKDNGSYEIDPAELHRVYPPRPSQVDGQPVNQGSAETELNASNNHLNAVLQAKLEAFEERLRDKDAAIADLRRDKDAVIADLREERDRWRAQAERLALTDQRVTPAKRRWWRFGRAGQGAAPGE